MRMAIALCLLCGLVGPAAAEEAASTRFEPIYREGQDPWRYFGGDEFPGARGRLGVDNAVRKAGARALRLDGDFEQGGAYVAAIRSLSGLPDPVGVALWVRGENLERIGVRLTDSSGQTHQIRGGVPIRDGEWTLLRLAIGDIVGSEHWGGPDDGRWHGPAKSISLLVGKPALMRPARHQGTLWVDDVALEVAR